MSNVNRQAAKRDFISSFRKVIIAPINVLSSVNNANLSSKLVTNNRPDSRQHKSNTLDLRCLTSSSNTQTKAPKTELAAKAAIMNARLEGISSLFSIEVALNLVHDAKASIERMAAFLRLGEHSSRMAHEKCETAFIQLIHILGMGHVKRGCDRAVTHLRNYDAKAVERFLDKRGSSEDNLNQTSIEKADSPVVAPLVMFLELVNVGDLIQQMLDVFYSQEMVATKLIDRDDFLNAATKEKKRFEQMLDERVAAGLNTGIDVLMDEVEIIFATVQKSDDFSPGLLDTSATSSLASNQTTVSSKIASSTQTRLIDIGPTETARRITALVSSHTEMLVGSTEKAMLDVFNQEVGSRLFGKVCKHIKKQRISTVGAVRLIRYVIRLEENLLSRKPFNSKAR